MGTSSPALTMRANASPKRKRTPKKRDDGDRHTKNERGEDAKKKKRHYLELKSCAKQPGSKNPEIEERKGNETPGLSIPFVQMKLDNKGDQKSKKKGGPRVLEAISEGE